MLYIKWIPTVLVVALMLGAGVGCGRGHRDPEGLAPAAPAKAPVTVETAVISLQDLDEYNEFSGTVQSRVTVEITSRLVAHILDIPVRSGSLAKEGDVLVTLDDRDAQSRLKQVESTLTSAQAVLADKETDFKRYQELYRTGAESQQQLDQARTQFETAKAAVAQIEEQVKEARINLTYTKIRSPMDGIVVNKHAEAGDLAAPGRSLLTLQKPTDLWLEAAVSEACARRIHTDDVVSVNIESMDRPLASHVTEIVPMVDPKSRSFLVRAGLPANLALRPGMFGRLQFRCETRKAIAVPATAIVSRGQLDCLYVAEDGHATLRLVRLGRRFGDRVEVLSGAQAGETLLVKPPVDLADGDPIVIQAPPPASTPGVSVDRQAEGKPAAEEAKP